jgi:phage gp29-like protein
MLTPRMPYREIPNFSWTDVDSVQQVKAAIRQLEFGHLQAAALIVDAMRRDDRISACLDRRTQALPALPFRLEPGEGAQAQRAMDALEESFEEVFPDAVLGELQSWEVMLGISIAQLLPWEERGGLLWPRLKVWHPRHLMWRWDTRAWHINTETEASVKVTPGDGQWLLYASHSLDRAYMWGASRYLYVPWLLRQWGLRDWGRWSEVYGTPIRKAFTPAAADEADKQRFLDEVTQLGVESTIRLPTSADPSQKFDVELLEAKSTGSDGFDRLVSKAEAGIAICILGQNLSTEVKGGSYAAAQVHESIRGEILQADAQRLAVCLREHVLKPWAALNFGDANLAPRLCWNTEPPADKVQVGVALKGLGEGISALKAAGANPDVDELLEDAGVPISAPAKTPQQEAEEAEEKAEAAKQAAEALQPGGRPPDAAGSPVAPPPPAPAKALAARLEGVKASGAVRGQLYIDAVADDAKAAAVKAVAPDVHLLLTAVMNSSDFEGLKAQLVAAFGTLEPDALADLVQKAMVMAELAGRLSALEDVGASRT